MIATLLFGLLIPTIILTIYLLIFEKEEFRKLYNDKYDCMLIGIGGFFASLSWFYAFTLIQASFVRAVGQIELLFSYFSSRYFFKEKVKATEIIGIIIFLYIKGFFNSGVLFIVISTSLLSSILPSHS